MYFGQTSNWRKQHAEVTHNGQVSYPQVASQYQDGTNAIRVYCGTEAQVLMQVHIFLTSEADFEVFDQFLRRFGLPRNGYQVVNTCQPSSMAAAPAGPAPVYREEPHALLAPPSSNYTR